jgi:excisionase family DNA binding protein
MSKSPAPAERNASRHAVARLALSPDEVAAALGVSRDYVDQHIAHELRWVRRGRRKFVAIRELERWLEEAGERTL